MQIHSRLRPYIRICLCALIIEWSCLHLTFSFQVKIEGISLLLTQLLMPSGGTARTHAHTHARLSPFAAQCPYWWQETRKGFEITYSTSRYRRRDIVCPPETALHATCCWSAIRDVQIPRDDGRCWCCFYLERSNYSNLFVPNHTPVWWKGRRGEGAGYVVVD